MSKIISLKNKVKSCDDVIADFYNEGDKNIKGFRNRLEDAKKEYSKRRKDYEKNNPSHKYELAYGFEYIPIEKIRFNYDVQRDLNANHCLRIMENFDPRVVRPGCAVKKDDGFFYVYDSQHTIIVLIVLLGVHHVPMTWVETDEPYFDAIAFDKLNNSSIMRADMFALHKTYLYRHSHGDIDKTVILAAEVQKVFDECKVNLEPKRVRKSPGKRGEYPHYSSHCDYSYKGYDLTSPQAIKQILNGIKKYYGNEEDGAINQGLFIGLCKIYNIGKEENSLDFFPENWVDLLLESMKEICGSSADAIHSAAKKQWQHTRGTSWDAPVAMATLLRELFLLSDLRMKFNVPAIEKSYVLYNRERKLDICKSFMPYFKISNENTRNLQIV